MKVLINLVLSFAFMFNLVNFLYEKNDVENIKIQQPIYSIEKDNKGLTSIYTTIITPNEIVKITSLNGRNIKEIYGYDFAQGFVEFSVEIKNSNNDTVYKNTVEKQTVYNSIVGKYKIAEYNLNDNDIILIKSRFKLLTKINGKENIKYFAWSELYNKDNNNNNNIQVGIVSSDDIRIKNQYISYNENQYTDGTYPVFIFDLEYSNNMNLLLQNSMNNNNKVMIISEYRTNIIDNWKSTYIANSRNPYICNNRIVMIEPNYINTSKVVYIRIKLKSIDKDNNIIFESSWKYIKYNL